MTNWQDVQHLNYSDYADARSDMMWKVTYKIDNLDNNPDEEFFYTESEAQEWVYDEVMRRVAWHVTHSSYPVTEEEYNALQETEFSLVTIKQEGK